MRQLYLSLGLLGILLIALALSPQSVLAEGDPPPTPRPIHPPWITGQNTRVSTSSTPADEIAESAPAGVDSPSLVGLAPLSENIPAPVLAELAVPQRYQDPDDSTCGAAALGMALEFLSLSEGGEAPTTGRLVQDLDSSGLLYESGTGVEELAYLARAYGYRGASPVHGWTLEGLAGELAAGRPAVVSLGLNGQNQPGHFVTVTGMAADGSWVTYNDPILGQQTVSAEEFLAAWGSQGFSGLTVRKGALAAASDPLLPWMGLLGAVSTLAVLSKHYPLGSRVKKLLTVLQGTLGNPRRPGLGGKLEPVYQMQQVQVGTKTVIDYSRKIPEYTTRWVQKGVKTITDYSKKIYEYGTRWVKKGVKKVTDYSKKIYEYGTRWVKKGWKKVKDTSRKIYEYGTRWVTRGWKKVTSWAKGIWGWFKKTKWVPKKVKQRFVKGWHYATKKVPRMVKETFVKGWHYATKTVPNLVKETFVKGWKYATKTVPRMVKETVQDGWHYATKEVPKYAWQQVQVGWKEVQQSAKDSVLDPDWWRQGLANAVSSIGEFFNRATQGAQAITGLVDALLEKYHDAPWYAQAGISVIPGADLIDIGTEFKKWVKGEDVDKWVLGLAAAGLVMDLGWADGLIPDPADGGNAFFGAVKAIMKQMPDGPSRELLEKMLKDPEQYGHLFETLIALQKNGAELDVLLKNDDALAVVLRRGPEAIDLILEHGDEAVKIVANYGDDGLAAVKLFGDDAINLITSSDEASDMINYLLRHADDGTNVAADASRAISAAERLKEVGLHSDEADELIDAIVECTTRGGGDRVVIGEWVHPSQWTDEYGGYLKEQLDNGGMIFETPPGWYDALGSNKELADAVNERFLEKMLDEGYKIEYFGDWRLDYLTAGEKTGRVLEIKWLRENAIMVEDGVWVKK